MDRHPYARAQTQMWTRSRVEARVRATTRHCGHQQRDGSACSKQAAARPLGSCCRRSMNGCGQREGRPFDESQHPKLPSLEPPTTAPSASSPSAWGADGATAGTVDAHTPRRGPQDARTRKILVALTLFIWFIVAVTTVTQLKEGAKSENRLQYVHRYGSSGPSHVVRSAWGLRAREEIAHEFGARNHDVFLVGVITAVQLGSRAL